MGEAPVRELADDALGRVLAEQRPVAAKPDQPFDDPEVVGLLNERLVGLGPHRRRLEVRAALAVGAAPLDGAEVDGLYGYGL